MINEWIIYQKQNGSFGVLPSFVKKLPVKAKVIEEFSGKEEEVFRYVDKLERESEKLEKQSTDP